MSNKKRNIMNIKDRLLGSIINIVIYGCKSQMWNDSDITKENVLGQSKNENVCLARAILVGVLIEAGYTKTSIAGILKRTTKGVGYLLKSNYLLLKTSRLYRIVKEDISAKCRSILL